ncbi:hypothetical protein Taro_026083 [Colocasia esculenta]|uniref:Uncharacterized protein n=1 Tax=Colocasia esculenta TaxID=4460 RepID=A0A843VMI0_COLES|nr:hypothetical protein [Colocasia esculenta]
MWSSSTSLCINPEICREFLAFKGPLVSTLVDIVSTHCPKSSQKSLHFLNYKKRMRKEQL